MDCGGCAIGRSLQREAPQLFLSLNPLIQKETGASDEAPVFDYGANQGTTKEPVLGTLFVHISVHELHKALPYPECSADNLEIRD